MPTSLVLTSAFHWRQTGLMSHTSHLMKTLWQLLDRVGFSRGLLVHAGANGFDCGATRDALARGQGRLRGVAFGMYQLAPSLPRFHERYPDIELVITVTDRLIDLMEENADVAIRNGHLRDSSLVARRICDLHRVICASPGYVRKHGVPKLPQALLHHNCISISAAPPLRRWPFDSPGGIEHVDISGNTSANNAETLLQLAATGVGIIRLADVIVADGIRAGWRVPLLQDVYHRDPLPLSAVYLPGKHKSPRVAAFVNFLVETFSSAPWRLAVEHDASGSARAAKRDAASPVKKV